MYSRNERYRAQLFYLSEDCKLVSDVVYRDGMEYHNMELFRMHLKKLQEIIDSFDSFDGEGA